MAWLRFEHKNSQAEPLVSAASSPNRNAGWCSTSQGLKFDGGSAVEAETLGKEATSLGCKFLQCKGTLLV